MGSSLKVMFSLEPFIPVSHHFKLHILACSKDKKCQQAIVCFAINHRMMQFISSMIAHNCFNSLDGMKLLFRLLNLLYRASVGWSYHGNEISNGDINKCYSIGEVYMAVSEFWSDKSPAPMAFYKPIGISQNENEYGVTQRESSSLDSMQLQRLLFLRNLLPTTLRIINH